METHANMTAQSQLKEVLRRCSEMEKQMIDVQRERDSYRLETGRVTLQLESLRVSMLFLSSFSLSHTHTYTHNYEYLHCLL